MPHEDAQAYSSPAKKKRETLPIPKQRVTSFESTSRTNPPTKSILAAHTYGAWQSVKRSGIHQGAIAAKTRPGAYSFFALAPGSGLTAHPGINPG